MSLKLFLSDTLHVVNKSILEELKKNRTSNAQQIIIVPDRFTLSGENDVLKNLGVAGAFDVSVTSFKRLAHYVLGKKADKVLSQEGAVMLLTKVIIENRENLVFYKKASEFGSFPSEMYAVITSIRNNCYTVQDLKDSIPSLPEYIQEKTKDVVFIFEKYLEELSKDRMDGSTLLQSFAEEILESDYIAGAHVYVLDYFSFTGEQRRILEKLMRSAKSVNIALVKEGSGYKNSRIFPQKEYERLVAIAKKSNQKIEEVHTLSVMDKGRQRVAREMFSYSVGEKTLGGKGICIYEATSMEEEIVHLARIIKNLVKEGYRYRDIAVLSGDVAGTATSIKRIFSRHEIPYFADQKTILSCTPLVRFVRRSLLSSFNRLTRDTSRELIKNPFSGISDEEAFLYDEYVSKFSLNYIPTKKAFSVGKNYHAYNTAEKVRSKIPSLICNIEKIDTAENHAKQVENFLNSLNIEEKITDLARKQREIHDEMNASCTEQSYKKLLHVLEEIKAVLKDTSLSREEFLAVYESAMSAVNISYAPMYVDNVYVGGAKESRFTECKVLIVANATSGKLPLERDGTGIFGDSEERALKRANIDLSPTALESGLEEKLHVLQLLLMPKERLFITYYTTDSVKKSEMVDDLKALFSDVEFETTRSFYGDIAEKTEGGVKRALKYLTSAREVAEYAYAFSDTDTKIGKILSQILGKEGKNKEKREVLPIENGEKVFFPYKRTSISQIEKYLRCPYLHYFERGLSVRPMETASSATFAGSFLHLVLELGLKKYKEQNYPKVDGEEFSAIVEKTLEECLARDDFQPLHTDKFKTTKRRLVKEGKLSLYEVAKRVEEGDYKPCEFEYSFGFEDPFYIEGNRVKVVLTGKIDRIDRCGKKDILLDYKTGGLPAGAEPIYYGTGVQLYVYMAVLDKKGRETVGSFYYPLRSNYVKEGKTKERLKGYVLASEWRAFDGSIRGNESSTYIDADTHKGKLRANAAETLCNERELQALKDYSLRICEKAVDEIGEGNIAPSPLDEACKYCNYKVLCKGLKVYERAKNSVKKHDLDVIINGEEEVTEDGE